jgi:hypothetical protein
MEVEESEDETSGGGVFFSILLLLLAPLEIITTEPLETYVYVTRTHTKK